MPSRALTLLRNSVIAAIGAFARPAAATENWNQWNEPAVSGVGRGATKLSLGAEWAHVPGTHTIRLAADFEHLLRDHWGVTARAGLPVGGAWIAPALLGIRLHALARSPFDVFAGAAGGVAWMRPDVGDARVDPMVSAEAGLTLHYWAFFFFEAGARYDVIRYAASTGAIDQSGLVVGGRTGVYF